MAKSQSYSIVESLHQRNLILLDWGESIFEILVRIDERKAWPAIKKAVEDNDVRNSFRVKRYIGLLAQPHQIEFLTKWLEQHTNDGYTIENLVDVVLALELPNMTRLGFLRKLERYSLSIPFGFRNLYALKQRIAKNINSLNEDVGVAVFS